MRWLGVVSSSFFSFLENLRSFSFIFLFSCVSIPCVFRFPCWFKWIEMDKSDWSFEFMGMVGIEEWMEILVLIYE